MRARESGMPDAEAWSEFFDPDCIVAKLGCDERSGDVVDFGCGYGIFTIAAARIVRGTVYALDLDPAMIAATGESARAAVHATPKEKSCRTGSICPPRSFWRWREQPA